mmetsp:Transcript_30226/g.76775  ORF Transcript_30226/g.76775 Transcript_30226/m.76775 type:complete len:251 (-) Transcript_30226:271-1023(-)
MRSGGRRSLLHRLLRGPGVLRARLQGPLALEQGGHRRAQGARTPAAQLREPRVPRGTGREADRRGDGQDGEGGHWQPEARRGHMRRRVRCANCRRALRAPRSPHERHADPAAPRQEDPAGACQGRRTALCAPGRRNELFGRQGVPGEGVNARGGEARGVRRLRWREAVPLHRGGHGTLRGVDDRAAEGGQPGCRRAVPGIPQGQGICHRPRVRRRRAQDGHGLGLRQAGRQRRRLRVLRHGAGALGLAGG